MHNLGTHDVLITKRVLYYRWATATVLSMVALHALVLLGPSQVWAGPAAQLYGARLQVQS